MTGIRRPDRPRRSRLALLVLLIATLSGIASPTAGGQTPAAPPASTPVAGELPYVWLQIGPDGALLARAIASGDCPAALIDGAPATMQTRAAPSEPAFPVRSCELPLPRGARDVEVAGQPLRLPSARPLRIAVLGDTGCRLKDGEKFQACNDPASWPLAEVAARIAAWQPDLIVHVGDYVYREAPCPAGNEGCAGSPFGDNWTTWKTDFFAPVAPLLTAAPWIFLRGNHEICEREGNGWFRLLDPRPMPDACERYTEPYAVQLGALRLVVLDAAEAGDVRSSPEETATYERQFREIEGMTGDGTWLLSHKPLRGILQLKGEDREVGTETFVEAFRSNTPPGVDLVVSGHIHLSQALVPTESSGRPLQIIAGNGGTELDRPGTSDFTGAELADPDLVEAFVTAQIGYWTIERAGAGITATSWDDRGTPNVTCDVVRVVTPGRYRT